MIYVITKGTGEPRMEIDALNSTATPLGIGATFTGTARRTLHPDALLIVQASHKCSAWIEYSLDGTNFTSYPNTSGFSVKAGVNEIHVSLKALRYFRVKITNTSGSAMTYLRAQLHLGTFGELVSPINSVISSDADAKAVRPLDFNLLVAQNLYEGYTNTIKDGLNNDIDTATVPEDLTGTSGPYAGFPTVLPAENAQLVVSGADTGTVYYAYMSAPTDTDYLFATKAVAGAGTYALGHPVWRSNFMFFIASSPTATNVGDITLQNTPTTANVFCVIPAGLGQSYCSAYTVPANCEVFIDRITGSVRGSATGSLDGYFYYRDSINGGYRLRFPFELQFGTLYFDDVDYLIRVPAGVDFVPRIVLASANNLQAKISYRIVKAEK